MISNYLLKATILFFLLMSCMTLRAQKWVELMLEPNANYYNIKNAFYNESANSNYIKGKGWKQFHRWENFWETRIMEDGKFPIYSKVWEEYTHLVTQEKTNSRGLGNWQPIGPYNYSNTDSWSPGTGRVNCIVEDPNNSNVIYIGTPSGGVWKSNNAGISWVSLGDQLSTIGVSGITIDPSNSNIIYLCTGDTDGGDTYSIGVVKSLDGGLTWNPIGGISANKTSELIIDPSNSNILYLASSIGILKSVDSGNSWQNIKPGNFRDIDMKPGNSNIIYAASSSAFYKSTDAGTTWNAIFNGLPNGSGRIAIATTPANSNYVYVLCASTASTYLGVYRSSNSGNSFNAMNTTTNIFQSTQAWYDMALAVSPTNENEIITGVMNVWRSNNGGYSFTQLNSWSNPNGAAYTHADIHYLKYFGGNLYCGSDGGIYKSTNSGNSFADLSGGLQIGQFYRIGGSQNDVNAIAGGLQDNGGYNWDGSQWKIYYGADGMEAGVDVNNSNKIFGMIQYGDLYGSNNAGNSNISLGSPESGRWVTPMAMDQNNNRLLAGYNNLYEYNYTSGWNQISTYNFPQKLRNIEIYEGNSNIIYVSTDDNIYRTVDGGNSFINITGSLPSNSVITSIEVNPSNSNEIWITRGGWTSGSHVFYSLNGGNSWINITNNLPNLPVNIVKHDENTNGGIYVGTDIGVYYYDNDLGLWTAFMNNLPNVIVNDLEINEDNSVIRAGTYGRGVWESPNFSSVDYDIGIKSIIKPNSNVCSSGIITPKIELTNYGIVTLTSATINYNIDGNNNLTYNWTGNINQGDTEIVNLPFISTTPGSHTFNVYTSLPNGQPDENPNNDNNSSSFNLISNGNPLAVNIVTDCWGSETTWIIRDSNYIVVASGGSYTDVSGGEVVLEDLCLPDGCYEFVIYDSYGDGLFGSQYNSCSVDGDYSITDGGNTVYVDMVNPDFGDSIVNNFCISNNVLLPDFSASDTTICENESIDFTDLSLNGNPISWNWSFPGSVNPSSISQNPTGIQYNNPGNYDVTLTVTDSNGSYTVTLNNYINVLSKPVGNITPNQTICQGDSSYITATGAGVGGTYNWDNNLGIGSTQNVSPDSTTTYTATITNSNNCSNDISTTINVDPIINNSIMVSGYNLNANQIGANYLWLDCDSWDPIFPLETNQSYTPMENGNYAVVITGESCTDTSNCVTINGLGLNKLDNSNVLIYPNPTEDIVNIEFINYNTEVNYHLYNAQGKLIKTENNIKSSNVIIDLSVKNKGVYFINITSKNNSKVYKIVKQ